MKNTDLFLLRYLVNCCNHFVTIDGITVSVNWITGILLTFYWHFHRYNDVHLRGDALDIPRFLDEIVQNFRLILLTFSLLAY